MGVPAILDGGGGGRGVGGRGGGGIKKFFQTEDPVKFL